MDSFLDEVTSYLISMPFSEGLGLIFGLLTVIFLIREHIITWPLGIIYTIISLVVFWQQQLYSDLLLHVIYLGLNIYGWYQWKNPSGRTEDLPITRATINQWAFLLIISALGTWFTGFLFSNYTDASLPYWDSTTSVCSIAAMWLTARKKIDSWFWWFAIDVLAAGIYFYKGMYFYALLYFVYIGMAVAGYIEWKKHQKLQIAPSN